MFPDVKWLNFRSPLYSYQKLQCWAFNRHRQNLNYGHVQYSGNRHVFSIQMFDWTVHWKFQGLETWIIATSGTSHIETLPEYFSWSGIKELWSVLSKSNYEFWINLKKMFLFFFIDVATSSFCDFKCQRASHCDAYLSSRTWRYGWAFLAYFFKCWSS